MAHKDLIKNKFITDLIFISNQNVGMLIMIQYDNRTKWLYTEVASQFK